MQVFCKSTFPSDVILCKCVTINVDEFISHQGTAHCQNSTTGLLDATRPLMT